MDLVDKLATISNKISDYMDKLETEEATKNALIMPFIAALGYDVFNPGEVHPEYCADIGTKKGEKVDYAIKKDDQVIMLMECKSCKTDLAKEHMSQLFRYFHVTSARFGILTNGVQYQFYSDLEEDNKMDEMPFLIFDLRNFSDHQIAELKKFTKSTFAQEEIVSSARIMKSSRAIKQILEQELEAPSEAFVKFFVSQIYTGKLTQHVIESYSPIVKMSFSQYIKGKISDSLQSALSKNEEPTPSPNAPVEVSNDEEKSEITTTEIERTGFYMVQAILQEIIEAERVVMRDAKSYCAILLDDNNRKPICRLWFNTANLYLGLFTQKTEEKVHISKVSDIYKYADRLKETVKGYEVS